MANSSFETFKQGGEAMEDAAKKTGQQAQGALFRIIGRAQNRHEQPAQRQDCHAGGAGERGEKRANESRGNRRAAAP